MYKKLSYLFILGALSMPSVILAELYRPPSPVDATSLASRIETAIWIIFTCIVVVCFVIAGVLFLTAGGQPEKIQAARSAFIWGIAGVAVGIIAYSIIAVVSSVMGGGA